MKPSSKILEDFKRLYAKEFGQNLSDAEAHEHFSRLVNVLRIVCFPSFNQRLDNPGRYDRVPRNLG